MCELKIDEQNYPLVQNVLLVNEIMFGIDLMLLMKCDL